MNVPTNSHDNQNEPTNSTVPEPAAAPQNVPTSQEIPPPNPVVEAQETKSEQSVFDLLSDIDFTVEQKPLMPEIKVPQISESAIKKPIIIQREEPIKPVPKEEVIERPAKRDLFSDPSLLNKFTQEVKNLQKLTDSLINKTAGGLTVLDAKWKTFQDVQVHDILIFIRLIISIPCPSESVPDGLYP